MRIEIVAEHSIVPELLTPQGLVLDVGCRSFTFSKEMARRGMIVRALDPDPTIVDPHLKDVIYHRLALDASCRKARFVMATDPQARRIAAHGEVEVETVDISTVSDAHHVSCWEVVKLDCEGSEMGILETWPGPIAKQITVEFHEHVAPQPLERYERIISHLDQWYTCVQHEQSKRHCIGTLNWWDSLWVLK